jgi:uncharacterized protein (DUF362 family)/ferredoxin
MGEKELPNAKSRVAVVRCTSYENDEVRAAVARGIELCGGIRAFIAAGEHIVLKPNILSGTDPSLCVITHPAVFAAVARLFCDSGVRLSYGDSPAIGKAKTHMRKAGYADIAESMSIPLADFDAGRTVAHHSALICGKFSVAHGVLAADGLVSICKLKTQGMTRITGAVKNQYGCVPGLIKAQMHARYPLPNDFSAMLVDINTFVRPRLYIMDAVYAMEGNGPNSGDPKKLNAILISHDPVALDTCACRIIDIDPAFVPTCVQGEKAGLGTCRPEHIEVVGDALEGFVDKSFKVVRKPPVAIYGTGLKRIIKNMLAPRPSIDRRLCTRCGSCVNICPANPKALYWRGEAKKAVPRFESLNCIRCYCCQETCPERAIRIKTVFIARLASVIASVAVTGVHRYNNARRAIRKWRQK